MRVLNFLWTHFHDFDKICKRELQSTQPVIVLTRCVTPTANGVIEPFTSNITGSRNDNLFWSRYHASYISCFHHAILPPSRDGGRRVHQTGFSLQKVSLDCRYHRVWYNTCVHPEHDSRNTNLPTKRSPPINDKLLAMKSEIC